MQTIIGRARELFPNATPRLLSDKGPQFLANDFKEFIRVCGMTHVKTSPQYPQSKGTSERWHKTLKGDCIRVLTPLSQGDARRSVADYVLHDNTVRLHSAQGYVTPLDKLTGRDPEIFAARDRKPAEARERRRQQRQAARALSGDAARRRPRPGLHRPAGRRDDGCRAEPARLPAAQQPGCPTTRVVPVARLDVGHQPLLLRQPGGPHLPLLPMRPVR